MYRNLWVQWTRHSIQIYITVNPYDFSRVRHATWGLNIRMYFRHHQCDEFITFFSTLITELGHCRICHCQDLLHELLLSLHGFPRLSGVLNECISVYYCTHLVLKKHVFSRLVLVFLWFLPSTYMVPNPWIFCYHSLYTTLQATHRVVGSDKMI